MSLHHETFNVSFACTICDLQGIKNGSLDKLFGKGDNNCVMNCDTLKGGGFDLVLRDFLCCFMYHYLALISAKNFQVEI